MMVVRTISGLVALTIGLSACGGGGRQADTYSVSSGVFMITSDSCVEVSDQQHSDRRLAVCVGPNGAGNYSCAIYTKAANNWEPYGDDPANASARSECSDIIDHGKRDGVL